MVSLQIMVSEAQTLLWEKKNHNNRIKKISTNTIGFHHFVLGPLIIIPTKTIGFHCFALEPLIKNVDFRFLTCVEVEHKV